MGILQRWMIALHPCEGEKISDGFLLDVSACILFYQNNYIL